MPGVTASLAAIAAATLTMHPSLAAAPGPFAPVPTQVCAPSNRVTTHELTDDEAAQILQTTRELVTSLTTTAGDDRASELGAQLRSMGITPAVDSGWRQQAHDLADTLLSEDAPRTRQVALILAQAGISATPADLQQSAVVERPAPPATAPPPLPANPTSEPTPPAEPAAAPSAPAATTLITPGEPAPSPDAGSDDAVVAISTGTSSAATGALTAAIVQLRPDAPAISGAGDTTSGGPGDLPTDDSTASTAEPDCSPTDPGPSPGVVGSDSAQPVPLPAPVEPARTSTPTSTGPQPAATPDADSNSDNSRTAETSDSEQPGGATARDDAADSAGADDPARYPADADAASSEQQAQPARWEQLAETLATTLADTTDPEATALGERLTAAGITARGGDTDDQEGSPDDSNSDDSGSSDSDNDSSDNSSSSSDNSSDNISGAIEAGGEDESREGNGGSSSTSSDGTSEDLTTTDGGSWENLAEDLADALADAGQDPAVEAIADKLTAAGITIPEPAEPETGSTTGGTDSSNGTSQDDQDSGSTSSDDTASGEASSEKENDSAAEDSSSSDDESSSDDSSSSDSSDDENSSDDSSSSDSSDDESSSDDSSSSDDESGSDDGGGGAEQVHAAAVLPAPSSATDAAVWERLAGCESGGQWDIDSGNGYHGGLQFDAATWEAHSGGEFATTAAQASREQQIAVAERLRAARGDFSAWPACAVRLGLDR